MASEIQKSIGENASVKMRRSRVETALHIVLKGNPEETEKQIQKIHDSLVVSNSTEMPTLDQSVESGQSEPIAEVVQPVEESTYSNPFEPFTQAN
jgi:hypothetical protein